ncbi:Niemann-Pick type C-related protein 1 [Neolecta irregularis DAH-3]|uniref:Niemann-Pick type C-related protein 1 n=1 Tax=Neolecta irregularis (strain DAH-3) TaxID=1198029 RepID=A0A1U7LJA5_NEOID|nr:Niemann-Pick type C-related protein 1 [Neolecta irregularis DAH-3]|eukprot:OLL22746.1 Niemann-Pick type C-related protein 1 [Neolecta irregularis DAH-3]
MHWTFTILLLVGASIATEIHRAGYCAFRGQCGKTSAFGAQLPCPDNGPASKIDPESQKKLISLCGPEWADILVCCDSDQLKLLSSNLKQVESLISSCPACKYNFSHFFCQFTCSPNQSTFVDVTETGQSTSKKEVVTKLDYFVSTSTRDGFFDSCKDVKFSATNGYVMDLIGGGAENSTAFLKFLGDKKPFLGSPFQINFPSSSAGSDKILPSEQDMKSCSNTEPSYRCSCVDCPQSCPSLPELQPLSECKVGSLPCWSFAMILLYILGLVLFLAGYTVTLRSSPPNQDRVRLLRDEYHTDDSEEEGDIDGGIIENRIQTYRLHTYLSRQFHLLGLHCAHNPAVTIGSSLLILGILNLGWFGFSVETNPVKLWVSPTSEAANEKSFFDENFGPFFRSQQAFLTNLTHGGPVLSYNNLAWWFDVESNISSITAGNISFGNVCYQPTESACVVQSITGYWGGDKSMLSHETWKSDLRQCINQPVGCLPPYSQPLKRDMVLSNGDIDSVEAIITTWVLKNSNDDQQVEKAMKWEEKLKLFLLDTQKQAENRGLRLSFSTEVSLEQELNKSTNTDARIVVVSYIAMFLYASLSLGGNVFHSRLLVDSKFTLGMVGILIVLLSVSSSVGLFSFFGIKVTLIIAEVIPFLILAIGVDNIFLLSHELERINIRFADELVPERIARTLAKVGPSIMLSATCQFVAFFVGSFVGMPAVRNFAIYAAGAILINAVLQITMFIGVLSLDLKRANRLDCFPCIRASSRSRPIQAEGFLSKVIRRYYAPNLLKPTVKFVVIGLFTALLATALGLFPRLQLGLDQRIALPNDSYLIPYFDDLASYFESGPPLYFVTKEANITQRSNQKALCGRFSACNEFSLSNILEQERQRSTVSYIAEPAASWIDDFFLWGTSCEKSGERCHVCFENKLWNITMSGFPEGLEFIKYFNLWIDAQTTEECPLAGKAAYSDAIVIDKTHITVAASSFRSSHIALRTQEDFINAYANARRVAKEVTHHTGIDTFPYSVFYVFFDQYQTIVRLTTVLLSSAILAVWLITSLFLGSVQTGFIVSLTITMIVLDIIGVMVLWGISLNAVSVVNLVISVGIGVEFCSHIAKAFMVNSRGDSGRFGKLGGHDERVWGSLTTVGASVFTGITLTKFIGVTVLAFTQSKIFEIYYFRIWLALVLLAASHGLIFLPVMLSLFGGEGYRVDDDDIGEEWQTDAARRYTQALLTSENSGDD